MFAFVEQVSVVNACSKGLSPRALDVCNKLPISMGMLNFAILQRGLFYAGILITGTQPGFSTCRRANSGKLHTS